MRALLFDACGVEQSGFVSQISYQPEKTADGGVEVDADMLAGLCEQCLDQLHERISEACREGKIEPPAAVAMSLFWHCFLGADEECRATTPIIHLLDTRSAPQVEWLRERIDVVETHRRTGCLLHTSYWPAKMLWLAEHHPAQVAATRWWLSFGEFLLWRFTGDARSSVSMVSASGIWNQAINTYDDGILAYLPVERNQLASEEELDRPNTALRAAYASRWPLFDHIPWYPALGDGACNNVGSGCVTPQRYALMVGTTGAMRVVLEGLNVEPPQGLWSYRLDRDRAVFGGAIANGGEVFAWMNRTLRLPEGPALEEALAALEPGSHGLTLLPFFAGERAPYWRSDFRAAITGMSLATAPIDILRAALESVALRFRQIYSMMSAKTGEPKEVIASGGALLRSPAWVQMMADALGRPIVACAEPEASSRGAALWVAERIGALSHLKEAPLRTSEIVEPRAGHTEIYGKLLAEQTALLNKIY